MAKVIFKKFNGTGELSAHLAQAIVTDTFKYEQQSGSMNESESYAKFAHTKNYEEADDLLLYGCKELQKKIENAGVHQMRMQLNSFQNKRKIYSTVVGFAANVPAYLAGTPNSMINVKTTKVRQKVLNFMYNTSVSCSVSAERIIKAAAKVVQAIMIVEAGGVRVNVWAGEAFKSGSDPDCLWLCKIKDAGQRMDTLKMAYPIAHPSMLRRRWFKLLETTEGVPSSYTCGYGSVIDNEKRCMETLQNAGVKNIHRALCFDEVENKSVDEIAKMMVEGVN